MLPALPPPYPRNYCVFHAHGRCSKGAQCPFSHDDLPVLPTVPETSDSPPSPSSPTTAYTYLGIPLSDLPAPPAHPPAFSFPIRTKPCSFFLVGKCKRGDACTYLHATAADGSPLGLDRASIPCRFWLQGRCTREGNCQFRHDGEYELGLGIGGGGVGGLEGGVLPTTNRSGSIKSRRLSLVQLESLILKDGSSLLSPSMDHDSSPPGLSSSTSSDGDDVSLPQTPGLENTSPEAETITKSFLKSVRATVGAGAIVKHVVTGFESSRIILSDLPPDVSESELQAYLSHTGPITNLKLFPACPSASSASASAAIDTPLPRAYVDYTLPEDAAAALHTLSGSKLRSHTISARLEPNTRTTGTGNFRNKTIRVSWFCPSRIAWAHYGSLRLAEKEAAKLDGKTFKGRKITATLKSTVHTRPLPTSYTVAIANLPASVLEPDLRKLTDPMTLLLGQPTYDGQSALKCVRGALERFGTLESFEIVRAGRTDVKVKAYARFHSSEAAEQAARELHNKKQDFLGGTPLFINQVLSIKYTVLPLQYRALRPELEVLEPGLKADGVQVRVYGSAEEEHPGQTALTIRLDSEDLKALIGAKASVERVLQGETMMLDGVPVWDEFFGTPEGLAFCAKVYDESGAFVYRDVRRRAVCLFGSGEQKRAAEERIREKMKEREDERHVMALSREDLSYLIRGGLTELYTQLGQDNVRLNVASKRLFVLGDDSALTTVRQSLSVSNQSRARAAAHGAAGPAPDCPVCFCPVSQPLRARCGHSYCAECLRHYVNSQVFPIACPAPGCNALVPLPLIRCALRTDGELHTLLDAAFLAHVRSRASEFKYCPTPDCDQIYRPGREGEVIQCPSCLVRICPACHVPFHEGFTCREHREGAIEEIAYRKWKSDNGVKTCPNCKVDIQKVEGCNHLECTRCKIHLCWECLKTFDKGPLVYDHLTKEHGGIFSGDVYRAVD